MGLVQSNIISQLASNHLHPERGKHGFYLIRVSPQKIQRVATTSVRQIHALMCTGSSVEARTSALSNRLKKVK